jgi:hypothetical protein
LALLAMDANQGASKPTRPHHTDDEDEDEEDTDATADASARAAEADARIARVMVSRRPQSRRMDTKHNQYRNGH